MKSKRYSQVVAQEVTPLRLHWLIKEFERVHDGNQMIFI